MCSRHAVNKKEKKKKKKKKKKGVDRSYNTTNICSKFLHLFSPYRTDIVRLHKEL